MNSVSLPETSTRTCSSTVFLALHVSLADMFAKKLSAMPSILYLHTTLTSSSFEWYSTPMSPW